ncbi:MAG: methylated-DNA--[protein]-cysteine S-methyltransferase [Bdellovibrionota bacterium]
MSVCDSQRTFESPLGLLTLTTDGESLTECTFARATAAKSDPLPSSSAKLLRLAQKKLHRYFAGDRSALDDIPLAPAGTEFQREVWKQLRRIPFGATRSYGEIAARLGNPGATRAVGTACGKNPLVLFVPCHRVLAGGQKLGGFSAGLERKKFLLRLEGVEWIGG